MSELSQENEFVCVRVGELAGKTRDGAASVQVHVCECVCAAETKLKAR